MDAFGTVRIQAAPDHWMIDGPIVLAGLVLTAIVGTLHIIFPAVIVLLFLLPFSRRPYRIVVNFVEWLWLSEAAALIESVAGVEIRMSGDVAKRPEDRAVVIVLNHHCRLDWMFFWCAAARLGLLRGGALKIALKEGLRSAPFFGWAMQAFNFSFLSRADRCTDLSRLRAAADHCVGHGDRYALLLFPEGTDLSPSNRDKAKAFAKEKKLTVYQHLLHPRTAGFVEIIDAIGTRLDAVYDVTVRYDNHPKVATSEDPRPSEKNCLVEGCWPTHVHFEVERVPASFFGASRERPADKDKAAKWLTDAWERKERKIEKGPSLASTMGTHKSRRFANAFFLILWAIILATLTIGFFYGLGHAIGNALWLLTICAATTLATVTKYGIGLDGFEYARFPAPEKRE